jgi:hypothetical protein
MMRWTGVPETLLFFKISNPSRTMTFKLESLSSNGEARKLARSSINLEPVVGFGPFSHPRIYVSLQTL